MTRLLTSLLVLPLLVTAAAAFDGSAAQDLQNPQNPADEIDHLPAADDWEANLVLDRGDVDPRAPGEELFATVTEALQRWDGSHGPARFGGVDVFPPRLHSLERACAYRAVRLD